MLKDRRNTRPVFAGGIGIGGGYPITIQSMTNTDTRDAAATSAQINALTDAGCEIARVAVPDMAAADALFDIKKNISIPLAADIHFDYRLALRAIEAGVDKLRLNPGNIGSKERIAAVADAARERRVPIRIGVNSGSLEKDLLDRYGGVTAEALVESALRHVRILEDNNFEDIVISIKSPHVRLCIEAYELLADKTNYPLHIGITEAGTLLNGAIKSACGIYHLLANGIGDTVRVSLTDDPLMEVHCAKQILANLGLRRTGPEFISCPTCGRTEIDLISLTHAVEKACKNLDKNITIAVMGCAVNGPGEAREADIGIAGGKGCGLIFRKGEIIKKVPEAGLLDELMKEIEKI